MNMNMNMNQVPGSMHQNGFNMPNMNMMPTNLQSNMNPRRQPNIMQDPTLQQNVHQQKMHPPVPAMRPGCVPPYGMHQTLLHASKMQSPMGHSPNIPQSAVAAPPQMMSMPSSIAPNVPMHHPIHTSMTYGNQAPTVPGNVNFNQHMPYTPMDYHLGPSTSTHHTQGFDDFDDQQMMDFAQWANRDMNLYTFSNAYPQHVPPPVPTSESTSESIIALSRFRRFCKKVFGNRFYEGEFEDEPEPPLTAGIQYIEVSF
uniref:Uncharacterized protein n=1 Tax=Caenorhabditis japonica TaxID=281687 RepID=A0A8R1EVI9_CAEJA